MLLLGSSFIIRIWIENEQKMYRIIYIYMTEENTEMGTVDETPKPEEPKES